MNESNSLQGEYCMSDDKYIIRVASGKMFVDYLKDSIEFFIKKVIEEG